MSYDGKKNFSYSTVLTAPSTATAGTSLVVQSGDGAKFPAVPFNAVVWPANAQPLTTNSEIVRVTAISTDTFTIARTTSTETVNQNRSIIVGDQIMVGPTTKTMFDIEQAMPYNLLHNGGMEIWERGTTFTTPNSFLYTADRWKQIQEANGAWTFSQSTSVPTGFPYSLKAVNVTANNQAAFVQFLESKDAKKLQNQTVSFSFQAMTTAAKVISNLRVAILEWTGTADSPTNPISAWAQNGTNPTWATSWTLKNTPANLALASGTWTLFETEGVLLDTASMTNLAVVIWVDDGTITATDEFFIAAAELNIGPRASSSPFLWRSYVEELAICQRYFVDCSAGVYTGIAPVFIGSNSGYSVVPTPVSMRTTPTMTLTNGLITRYAASDTAWTSPTVVAALKQGISISGTTTGTLNGNSGTLTSPDGVLKFDCDL